VAVRREMSDAGSPSPFESRKPEGLSRGEATVASSGVVENAVHPTLAGPEASTRGVVPQTAQAGRTYDT
jgi:hypothetical protein